MRGLELWLTEPNKHNINEYPTIADIINAIIMEEESRLVYKYPLSHNKTVISKLERVGNNLLMSSSENNSDLELMPLSKSATTLYRGQSAYYKQCLPSLYRYSNDDFQKAQLKSRLQLSELSVFLGMHPIIKDCVNNKNIIEYLAQHYGIATTYLDLTTDKWIAAFFATTVYENGKYSPVDISNPKHPKYGVLYKFSTITKSKKVVVNDKIHYIGMHYFNRPGRQSAAVIDLKDERDLHKIPRFDKIFFRHDNDISNLIFNLSQQGRKLFPHDSLGLMIDKFLKGVSFSAIAANICNNKYYDKMSIRDFTLYMYKHGFSIGKPQLVFNSDIFDEIDLWIKEGRKRYNDSIVIIPVSKSSVDE